MNFRLKVSLLTAVSLLVIVSAFCAIVIISLNNVDTSVSPDLDDQIKTLTWTTIGVAATVILLGTAVAYGLSANLARFITQIREKLEQLAVGKRVDRMNVKVKDEIGSMSTAFNHLVESNEKYVSFAKEIGEGNLDYAFNAQSEEDILGNELLKMRDNLQQNEEDDRVRRWVNEGMAKFGDILRANNNDLKKLCDETVKNYVKYFNANQGSIFLLQDNEDDPYLELVSTYAFDKKKFIEKRIEVGQGILGQVILEKETAHFKKVPENYIKITSGLGDAPPRSLLITPMIVNEEIYGLIEMASFNPFASHEIEFSERLCESIASVVSSVKINQQTKVLLEESQALSEQFRSQEEELRQNMEEMQSTQEEMQRQKEEAEGTFNALNVSLATIQFDLEGNILDVNENFQDLTEYAKNELVGSHHSLLVDPGYKGSKEYKEFWAKLGSGEMQSGEYKRLTKSGKTLWLNASYAPIMVNGSLRKVLKVAYDITDKKKQSAEIEVKQKEIEAQNDKMKQVLKESQQKAADLELILGISSTLYAAKTVEEAYNLTLSQVGWFHNWPIGHIYLAESEELLVPSNIWHLTNPDAHTDFQQATSEINFEIGIGLPGRVFETKKPSWIKDVTLDDNFPRAEVCKQSGVKGAFAFPVLSGGKVKAVIEFFSEQAEEPNELLLQLMNKVGALLGSATKAIEARNQA
ncbi:MAG: GAF domain-containing protein [Bacteroidota bacterium]